MRNSILAYVNLSKIMVKRKFRGNEQVRWFGGTLAKMYSYPKRLIQANKYSVKLINF